ncbi:Ger(x)C family spore germination protein [Fictibacillus terranigra]|uniref:Ger(X)C family spore germination protein n=1 Tax=Fictibacillus terranigra TaxID=3058424 RepID=A0ABT8E8T6_9BACL|nr:Ger(x)C family spore germination protein [Fictibacillus sp. CENA-BCM004]MDN4074333.1 Ger(x)C family spore germination protein [Fictibacillus sp. CENA-BCM004]
MNRKTVFLILFLSVAFLSGCYSQKELTDLAIISALGIDKNENGRYVVTFQIVNPGNVAGGQQVSGGAQGPPITAFSVTGDNLVEISRKATTRLSRKMYYAHANLLVISEKLAKTEGILKLIDAFDRDPEFRNTASIVISRDVKAADFVKTLTPVDKIPSNKVIKTLKFSEQRWGRILDVNLQDVMKSLISPGKGLVLSGFRLFGDRPLGKTMQNIQQTNPLVTIRADGLAVFKDGKLVDWIEGKNAGGTLWILNKIKATDVDILWKKEKDAISYQVTRQQTKVSASMKKGVPVMLVDVRAEGGIGAVKVPVNLNSPNVILAVERALEKEIQKEIQGAVQHAQKDKSDIFGFGEVVHRTDPAAWKKLKHDWNDAAFPKVKVKVKVDAFVRRSGLRNKPFLSNFEK